MVVGSYEALNAMGWLVANVTKSGWDVLDGTSIISGTTVLDLLVYAEFVTMLLVWIMGFAGSSDTEIGDNDLL